MFKLSFKNYYYILNLHFYCQNIIMNFFYARKCLNQDAWVSLGIFERVAKRKISLGHE